MFYILLLAIPVLSVNAIGNFTNHTRHARNINGGLPDNLSTYPYMVAIIRGDDLWCAGTILTKFQVLTSGNCVTDKALELMIHAGSSFWANPKSVHHVKDFIVYGRETITNLAILKVHPPFHFDQLHQPVKLSPTKYALHSGRIGIVTGWNTRKVGVVSTQLISAKAVIMTRESCTKAYEGTPVGPIGRGQFCAGYNGKESCECDAGNPIVVDGFQVGIGYEGFKCGEYNYPTVYTDITHYHKWIRKQMIHKDKVE